MFRNGESNHHFLQLMNSFVKLSLNLESLFFKDNNLSTVPVFMTFGLGLFVLLAMSCHLGLGLFEL